MPTFFVQFSHKNPALCNFHRNIFKSKQFCRFFATPHSGGQGVATLSMGETTSLSPLFCLIWPLATSGPIFYTIFLRIPEWFARPRCRRSDREGRSKRGTIKTGSSGAKMWCQRTRIVAACKREPRSCTVAKCHLNIEAELKSDLMHGSTLSSP